MFGVNPRMEEAERPYDLSHSAIALRGEGASARLLAKGRGALAEQILDLAFSQGVKVRQDAALNQMLVAFDVDSLVPAPAMEAVAAVLAHVYMATGGAPSPPAADHAGEGQP